MKNDGLKVSVNIPIYNASKYLRKCLDSMMYQTLDSIEFILIDDGSTDGSSQICDEYAQRDKRFKVYHKENGGSASARQLALDKSKGEYVIVCDADDWAEPQMYEQLYNIAKNENADVSTCDYFVNYQDSTQSVVKHTIPNDSDKDLMRAVLKKKIPPASWIKLIRRDFILTHNISYEKGINLGEDYLFLIKIVLKNPKIIKLNQCLYHYRRIQDGNSYTNLPKYTSFMQMETSYLWVKQNIDSVKYKEEVFLLARDVGYLGIRVSNMNILHHSRFLKEEVPYMSLIRYGFGDLKSIIVGISKISRPLSVFIYSKLGRYFYK